MNSEQSPPTISVVVNKNPDGDDVSSLCSKRLMCSVPLGGTFVMH